MIYYLDTNIISYILRNNQNVISKIKEVLRNPNNEIKISVIVYYEILRGLFSTKAFRKIEIFKKFCEMYELVDFTENQALLSSHIYSELKATGNIIEDDDLFIGAQALENGATLITNNAKHLGRIKNLNVMIISEK